VDTASTGLAFAPQAGLLGFSHAKAAVDRLSVAATLSLAVATMCSPSPSIVSRTHSQTGDAFADGQGRVAVDARPSVDDCDALQRLHWRQAKFRTVLDGQQAAFRLAAKVLWCKVAGCHQL
jgi:hypothetical protein